MNTREITIPKNAEVIVVVDAPEVLLSEDDEAGDVLLHFFRALGWNGVDFLDPRKVRTTQKIYNRLCEQMHEKSSDVAGTCMLMVNKGPGVDGFIPDGKVYLLEGWIEPDSKEGDEDNAA